MTNHLVQHIKFLWYLTIRTIIYLILTQGVLLLPSVVIIFALWLAGKILQCISVILSKPMSWVAYGEVPKKTVLISGGSTVQSLHLARTLYKNGYRVVLCEIKSKICPSKFSIAVSRFYRLPRPESCPQDYVRALCDIVSKEQATWYIPVCQTSITYYDALAKPHLERLNCLTFCPTIKDVVAVEGVYEFLDMVSQLGLQTPICYRVTDRQQIMSLYKHGAFQNDPYVMIGFGENGKRYHQVKVSLSLEESDLMRECLTQKISEQKPWVIVQQPDGHRLITCTTVKDNCIINNVTCEKTSTEFLIPVNRDDVIDWIQHFLAHLPMKLSGFLTFQFVVPYAGRLRKTLIPLNCKVGMSLPFIWSEHQGIPWRSCQHTTNRHHVDHRRIVWLHKELYDTFHDFSIEKSLGLAKTMVSVEDPYFTLWDPVPFFVHFHVQAPLEMVREYTKKIFVWPSRHPTVTIEINQNGHVSSSFNSKDANKVNGVRL